MGEEEPILTNLVSGDELKSLARKRKDPFIFITIPKKKINYFLEDGWEIHRKNKKSTRLKKPKRPCDAFEDEVWYIISTMGYEEMNYIDYREELGQMIRENNFKVTVSKDPDIPPKQIDVFAKDDDTVLCIECKHSETIDTKRSFEKEIADVVANRDKAINTIQQHYGKSIKLKFGWIFVTKNIAWSEPDIKRAEEANIAVISDQNIEYYKDLGKHLGPAAKYQLLAEVFKKQDIPGLKIAVPALKGQMGKYAYYSFNIEPSKLLKIAYISHRRKMDNTTLVSYQRMLRKTRLNKIRQFIETDGVFPTSIVLNIESGKKGLRFVPITHHEESHSILGKLHLPSYYKSAWIIDGQHRLYGFSGSEYAEKTTVPVIAFEKLDELTQAKMFVDINHEQVRVSVNLLTELLQDLFLGSPDPKKNLNAVTSKIVNELRIDIGSPLRDRIAVAGASTSQNQPLTTFSVYDGIAKANLIGKIGKGNIFIPGPLSDKDNDTTIKRSKKILGAYLNEFKDGLPSQWDAGNGPGGYICTNGGIIAIILVLGRILEHIDKTKSIPSYEMPIDELIEEIMPYIQPVIANFQTADTEAIANYRRSRGTGGHRDSAYSMMIEINKKFQDFKPQGLDEYLERRTSNFNVEARNKTYDVQTRISKYVLGKLKEVYNKTPDQWWVEGVPLTVRQKIVQRREEDKERGDLEKYFLLINYKEIVSNNWELFKDKFSFAPGKKSEQTSWMDELNRIRNKVFHPEKGIATKEELNFINETLEKVIENGIG